MMSCLKFFGCIDTNDPYNYFDESQKWADGTYQKRGYGFEQLKAFEIKVQHFPASIKLDRPYIFTRISSNIETAKLKCESYAIARAKRIQQIAKTEWSRPDIWDGNKRLEDLDNLLNKINWVTKELTNVANERSEIYRTEMAATREGLLQVRNRYHPPYLELKPLVDIASKPAPANVPLEVVRLTLPQEEEEDLPLPVLKRTPHKSNPSAPVTVELATVNLNEEEKKI